MAKIIESRVSDSGPDSEIGFILSSYNNEDRKTRLMQVAKLVARRLRDKLGKRVDFGSNDVLEKTTDTVCEKDRGQFTNIDKEVISRLARLLINKER